MLRLYPRQSPADEPASWTPAVPAVPRSRACMGARPVNGAGAVGWCPSPAPDGER